jgi:hypothetical protein
MIDENKNLTGYKNYVIIPLEIRKERFKMAKLLATPYKNTKWDGVEPYREYDKRVSEILKNIGDQVIKFPVADGYALYFVKTLKPLVLQHIPAGDAWRISAAEIRGLRIADVEFKLKQGKLMRELFSRKG